MIYAAALFMLGAGYHTLTYGISVWKNQKNKLGGFSVILFSLVGTIVPMIVLFIKA